MKNLQTFEEFLNEAKITGLIVYVLPIGMINIPTGKTQYDWSIYDDKNATLYLMSGEYLLYGSPNSLKIGDKVTLVGNDTLRKLKENTVIDTCQPKGDPKVVIDWLYTHKMDYKPKRAFQKSAFPRKLMTSYSIKGVEIK